MDLTEYRNSDAERARSASLMGLVPPHGGAALDIGARDGFFSRLLAERFERVVALDLQAPDIAHERVQCVQGDITALQFADGSFDCVFCAEVLEHIPPQRLQQAGRELARVARSTLVIGVPYKQDLRLGRTTCGACGKSNPPWGHVNSFDEARLASLFPGFQTVRTEFVGRTRDVTNALSAALMDFAGNPYGTYTQEEPCVHCAARLQPPRPRNLPRKLATRLATLLTRAQQRRTPVRGNWIHMLLQRQGG